MLADLVLADLPIAALIALKQAINQEILKRKKEAYIERRTHIRYKDRILSPAYQDALSQAIETNTIELCSLPAQALRHHYRDRVRYLSCVLAQDWSHLFPQTMNTPSSYYVYAHIDPRHPHLYLDAFDIQLKGAPFYIGKGSGSRAWDLKRNQGHGKRIKQIRDAGFPDKDIWQIIANNLTETEALILEAKLIYLLGSIYDETINGCLVNLADHCKPIFVRGMSKLPSARIFKEKDI